MGAITRDLLSYALARNAVETVTLVTLISATPASNDGSVNMSPQNVSASARVVALSTSEINRLREGGITITKGVSVGIVGELDKAPDQVVRANGVIMKVIDFTIEENATVLICEIPPLGQDGQDYGSGYS